MNYDHLNCTCIVGVKQNKIRKVIDTEIIEGSYVTKPHQTGRFKHVSFNLRITLVRFSQEICQMVLCVKFALGLDLQGLSGLKGIGIARYKSN